MDGLTAQARLRGTPSDMRRADAGVSAQGFRGCSVSDPVHVLKPRSTSSVEQSLDGSASWISRESARSRLMLDAIPVGGSAQYQ